MSLNTPALPLPEIPSGQPLDHVLLQAFLQSIPDVVFFKDRQCRFVAVSESTARKHGLTVASMLGKTDFDFFAQVHAQGAYDDEQEIMRTGEPMFAKPELEVWSDGRETWSLTNKMALRDNTGEIVGTFGLCRDITEARRVELALEKAQQDLVDASRLAGMTEVATEVLHNVGNVLNTLNVSVSMISRILQQSRAQKLGKVADLLRDHASSLGDYLTQDEKGRLVPGYIEPLARQVLEEHQRMQLELDQVQKSVDHINQIVSTQQSYASFASNAEPLDLAVLVEDALRMKAISLSRNSIRIERSFAPVPRVLAVRGKTLQVLVNLISNARNAMAQVPPESRCLQISIQKTDTRRILLSLRDQGVGLAAGNLTDIFNHGFCTNPTGHGLGLHFCANAVREMGGSIEACSEGLNTGALFRLELPAAP